MRGTHAGALRDEVTKSGRLTESNRAQLEAKTAALAEAERRAAQAEAAKDAESQEAARRAQSEREAHEAAMEQMRRQEQAEAQRRAQAEREVRGRERRRRDGDRRRPPGAPGGRPARGCPRAGLADARPTGARRCTPAWCGARGR